MTSLRLLFLSCVGRYRSGLPVPGVCASLLFELPHPFRCQSVCGARAPHTPQPSCCLRRSRAALRAGAPLRRCSSDLAAIN